MTRHLMARVFLATALAVGGACTSGDGASNQGTGGSATGGTSATGGGSGGATGGEATGGQTTGGTGGIGGLPEQGGGHSGAGGAATGGHPSGGMGGSVLMGTGGGGAGGTGGATATGGAGGMGGATATGGAGGMGGATAKGGAGGTVGYAPCPTNGSPCKILPFGDSITEGVKSSDDAGYRSQIFKLIVAAKQKVTFVGSLTNGPTQVSGQTFPRMHEGHAGWTIDPGYSEFSGYGGISSLVPSPALNGGPHIVLLHIGANDLFPTKDGAGMATRLDALVEKIAQDAPSALVVLAQITPVGSTNSGHTQAEVAAANAAQMTYNSKIPAIIQSHVARGQHVIGVDMSKMPLSDLTTASVHPNDQGYAYMAGIWYAAIKGLLPQ
jgi:lysophospholipase L1-like esterase